MDSITLCNLSLNMLGINNITSFDDTNNNAQLCKTFFPVCRDRVLRDHAWSFAAAKTNLSALQGVESIDPDLPFVCSLPGDCIAVRDVIGDIPYRTWGRKIMVQSLPASVIYTARIEDTSLFDATFCEALQYILAAELGMSNTRNSGLIQLFRQEYERKLAIARSIDSSENRYAYQNHRRHSNWLDSRGAGSCDARSCTGAPVKFVEGTAGKQV
jgi:hypothetical protein